MTEINQEQLEKFRELGVIDETALRNYYIRKEFQELRSKGMKWDAAIRVLSEKYLRSESTINQILYHKTPLNKN